MTGAPPAPKVPTLLGRREECAVLDELLAEGRGGHSGVLALRGEAGFGKTALLEYAIAAAPDLTVLRAVGVESEAELAFAALHRLCTPVLDGVDQLPGPQRDALAITFGLRAGPVPDRFLVGLATLNLLSQVAHERPRLCVIDDAQWLDRASAQALAFVARRLQSESLVMLFAARAATTELAGLPELVVEGLDDDHARMLLASAIPGRLDERVADQLVAEAHGNPLALLEVPRGLSTSQLGGGFGLSRAPAREPRRGELPDSARGPPTGRPAAVARGRSGTDRRSWVAVARRRATPHLQPMGGRRAAAGFSLIVAMTAAGPALVRNLALEIAPVRVNMIAAGFVDTPLSASLLGDQLDARREELRATNPIRRVVGPDDVAALAVHLMTNTALTGGTYDIDGGQQLV